MLNVRRYDASDVADCAAVIESALPQLSEANEAARALVRAHAAPHLLGAELAGYHTVVATEGGRVLGLAALVGDEVRRVYVRPDAQRRGVGRRLMAELEREGRARGLGELRLTAGASAAGFYARLGYERLEEGA